MGKESIVSTANSSLAIGSLSDALSFKYSSNCSNLAGSSLKAINLIPPTMENSCFACPVTCAKASKCPASAVAVKFLNIGSAVTGPEVYLKALSMARNVARQNGETIANFTTAVFDVVQLPENWADGPGSPPQGASAKGTTHPLYYFRPWKTILCRTIQDGGRSIYVCGDHRETIPALWAALTQHLFEADSVQGDV